MCSYPGGVRGVIVDTAAAHGLKSPLATPNAAPAASPESAVAKEKNSSWYRSLTGGPFSRSQTRSLLGG